MERLTYRSPRFNNPVSNGACKDITCTFECDSCKINDLIEKLCAYEDTGLEPQDIISAVDMSKIACALHELNAYKDLGPIDHIRDLLQAENEGRLVVLPCGTDVELVRDGHAFKADHWSHTLTAFRDEPKNKSGKQIELFSTKEAEEALKGGEG